MPVRLWNLSGTRVRVYKMATFVTLAISLIITFISVTHGTTTPRKLTTILNPDCQLNECRHQMKNTSSHNLIYTRADGPKDSIHYIWSTIGAPTWLVFLTKTSSKLSINWDLLLNSTTGAFNFTEPPFYASALIISQLIEFNDASDGGNANWNSNSSEIFSSYLDGLNWDAANSSLVSSSSHAQVVINTLSYDNELIDNGLISLQFDATGLEEEHDSLIPKLLRNSNSTQIRMKLINLPSNVNNSRYGIEAILITSENPKTIGEWKVNEQDTLNDEYTPGVFKTVQISSIESQLGFGTYLTWKPVGYTSDELTVIDSTNVNLDAIQEKQPMDTVKSIANAYFTNEEIQKFNVTFGTTKDGFYIKYKHLSWSFVYGVGVPTNETFSIMVIMTVACGSGIPILLMIGSFAYMCYLKQKRKQHDN